MDDDKLANLPPEAREQVRQSRAFHLIATEIADKIGVALPDIADLSVAYSNGTAVISGICENEASIDQAVNMVSGHPDVLEVISSLALAPGDEPGPALKK